MMSFFSMLKTVPRWMWVGLIIIGILIGLTRWHDARVDKAVAHERERLNAQYTKALLEAQSKADDLTAKNAEATAKLDLNYYKEFQNATKNANYWRNRALTERVSNQTNCAANDTTHHPSSGMGNDTTATTIDNRQIDMPSTAIIELSEISGQMRAQVEYLQAKHLADARTVNSE